MLPDRYNLKNILSALTHPSKVLTETNRLARYTFDFVYHNKYVGGKHFAYKYGKPINVMEEDWDTLIILDACRCDMFEEVNKIEGQNECVVSGGSHSKEFIDHNFPGRTFHDTVYVTANVFAAEIEDGVFHDVILSFSEDTEQKRHKDLRSPQTIKEMAIEAFEQYPNKRLIIHFMQPHTPYFSSTAQAVRDLLREKENVFFNRWHGTGEPGEDQIRVGDLNRAAKKGIISPRLIKNIYKENIEVALEEVKELLQELDGKTVVTGDHGELLGESESFLLPPRFNHPRNVYMKELRIVPWLTIDSEHRREIKTEPPVEQEAVSQSAVERQLRALGYK